MSNGNYVPDENSAPMTEFIKISTGAVVDFIQYFNWNSFATLLSDSSYRDSIRGYAEAIARVQHSDIAVRWPTPPGETPQPDTIITLQEARAR